MSKIMDKLMRKFVPQINTTCIQFTAESMSDAEKMRDRLCDLGILPKSRENYSIWTGDGNVFTVEECVPCKTKHNVWEQIDAEESEMMSEGVLFDIDEDEWIVI